MKIINNPTENQLSQIKEWLINEIEDTGEGFYNNWDTIEKSFNENKLIVLKNNEEFPIGFIVFNKEPLTIEIIIASIKLSERKKGFGRKMVNQFLEYYKSEGALVSFLDCSPASTERIWKKLNFINYPDNIYSQYRNRMYKVLVPVLKPTSKLELVDETIELWEKRPYVDVKSKWIWKLDFISNSRKLKKPIIHPANYHWQLRWKKGTFVKTDKIDFFNQIDYTNFIIIQDLTNWKTKDINTDEKPMVE